MRRSRTITQRVLFVLLLYLAVVAFITYRQNWTTSHGADVEEFPDNSPEVNKNDGRKSVSALDEDNEKFFPDEPFYRILGDNETLPTHLPNGTSSGFTGEPKFILFWNGGAEFGQQHLGGCPDWNCRITSDRSYENRSAALIFYGGAYDSPKVRSTNQRYVFFTQESPMHSSATAPYPDFYNYTLGYRRDADAPCPYGYAIRRRQPLLSSPAVFRQYLNDTVSKKRKLAAWFVSNCGAPSGRGRLVEALKNFMQIDVYGACGTMSCPKGQACNEMLERDYRFYFAFENSICKDYMTEKFWERMNMNIVVVVLKRAIVERYVPPDSFIAVDDFPDVEAMAKYLNRLGADDEAYGRYLRWKNRYQAVYLDGREHDIRERPWGFCRLCRLLWENPSVPKTYPNAQHWWNEGAQCDHGLVDRLIAGQKGQSRIAS